MKILSFSLDAQILVETSVVASRNKRYGEALERYDIVVPVAEAKKIFLSKHTTVHGTGGATKLGQFLRMFILASQLLKREKHDVITSQDTYFLGLCGLILARIHHCGLEVQVLGIEKLNFFRKKLTQFTLSQAGSIRVLSKGLQQRLIQEFGVKEERMKLVPIYVDVSSLGFSAIQDETKKAELERYILEYKNLYSGRFNILSVNRLVPIKNIPMQLQMVASLKKEFPKILLHIVGGGTDEQLLQKQIGDLGIASNVILHGPKFGAELSSFFTQSNCFVLTSDFEGYGMVIIEAATAGIPIVMTNVGCAGEVVINRKSGLIVPPKDTHLFTEAVQEMVRNESLRKELSSGALASIAELPTFDTVLKQYQDSWALALENKW